MFDSLHRKRGFVYSGVVSIPPAWPADIRERNLAAVLDALQQRRPASRAEVAERTGLSKPTVGSALRTLEGAGVIREFGRTTGRRGPSASLYDVVSGAVLVLGIDIGARYVRAALADLDGSTVDEATVALSRPHATELLDAIRAIRRWVGTRADRTELAVAGSPGIVDPATGRISAAPNLEDWEGLLAARVLGDALGLRVVVENDVNLAAVGERTAGAGRGVDSFAYLNVGSGLGAGILLHGRLHRGARGAAGEVGFLPVGDDPFPPGAHIRRGAMESRLSSHALVALAEALAPTMRSDLTPPFEVDELFDAARAADPLGRAVVHHAAREIAVCVAGLAAVLDLDLVLLGGGIGVNGDLLISDARAAIARLVPNPPRIEAAGLDERAVRAGAVAIGVETARRALIRRLVDSNGAAPQRS
jgi:predicted NBD/HSP70 family sugar kinase